MQQLIVTFFANNALKCGGTRWMGCIIENNFLHQLEWKSHVVKFA